MYMYKDCFIVFIVNYDAEYGDCFIVFIVNYDAEYGECEDHEEMYDFLDLLA